MAKPLWVVSLTLLLGGCSTLDKLNEMNVESYRKTCQSFGYQPGTVDFANCVERRAQSASAPAVTPVSSAARGSQDQQKALLEQNQQLQQRNLELQQQQRALQQQNDQQQREIQGQQDYEAQRQLYQQNQQYQHDLEVRQEQDKIENQIRDAADGNMGGSDDSAGAPADAE